MSTEPAHASACDTGSPLRATLEVTPPESAFCPVVSEAPNAADVTRNSTDDACHSELTVRDGDRWYHEYVSGPRTGACACRTIGEFDCAFDVEKTHNGALLMTVVVDDRSILSDIIGALKETGATTRLCQLSALSGHGDATIEVDVTDVTEKQREAVELAIELGYYDSPRNATLSDLADRLEISKSAASQRLTAVETKLVRTLFEQHSTPER